MHIGGNPKTGRAGICRRRCGHVSELQIKYLCLQKLQNYHGPKVLTQSWGFFVGIIAHSVLSLSPCWHSLFGFAVFALLGFLLHCIPCVP